MSRTLALIVGLAALTIAAIATMRPATADAHPLGNFTVNRYSRLELRSQAVRIVYVLDMAEIPAFQEISRIDRDGDEQVDDAEREAYLDEQVPRLLDGVTLSGNGTVLDLRVLSRKLAFPEGQAGLSTLRLQLLLEAPASGDRFDLEYKDGNYADRLGWREIVVRPADGVQLITSTAPTEDVSDQLTRYPDDLLSQPLDKSAANVSYRPGASATAPAPEGVTLAAAPDAAENRPGGAFASLISKRHQTLPIVLVSLLIAFGLGAIHALEPGHGKTFVAAYFVGVKGRATEALLLGLIIAVTHSVGVIAIGLVTLYGANFIVPEKLYPWLSLASGLLIVGLGLRLLVSRLVLFRKNRGNHTDENPGEHAHEHGHRQTLHAGAKAPWRSLFALGLADGLVPSPSTLIVLLAAVALDRLMLGLLLVVAFSVGLASVLALISLSLVYVRRLLGWLNQRAFWSRTHARWLSQRTALWERAASVLPLAAAVVLLVVGFSLSVRAIVEPGLLAL